MNQGNASNTNQAPQIATIQNNQQNLSASQRAVQSRMNSSQKIDLFNQNALQAQSHSNDQDNRTLNAQINNWPLLDIYQQIENHNQNIGNSQEILINDASAQIDVNFNRSHTFYQSGSSLQNSNFNMNYNESNRNNAQNNCLRVNTYNMNLRAMDGNSSDTQDEEYRNQFQTRQIKWASGAGPLESDDEINEDQVSQSEIQGAHNSNDSSSQSSPPLASYNQAGEQTQNRRNVLERINANQNEQNSSDEEDDISNTTSQDDNQTASQTSNNLRDRLNDQESQNMNIQSLVARQANSSGIQLIQTSSNNRQNLFNRIISQQNQQIGILSQLNNRRNIVEQENRGDDQDPTNSYPTIIDIDENDDAVSMSDSLNIINTSSINNIQSQVGTIIRANNANSRFNQGAELAAELISNAYRQSQQNQNPNQPLTRQQREEQKQMANQNIDEIFKCFICFGKIQDAVLCPSCSKLCCRDCIRKWLTEQRQQCPHCRAHLQVHQLVNCRFVEEITAAFETLNQPIPDSQRNGTLEDGTLLRDGVEICKQHGARLDYYCQTCKIPICSECAMFGGEKHKDHKFLRLAEVYEKHCDVIKKEAECLKKRLKELTKHMNDVKSSIEKVTKAKEDKCKEIENFVENIQHKLNTKLKNKLLTLLNQRQTMQDEIEQLDEFHNKLNQELTKMPKTALIKKSGDLIRQLKEIHTKEPHRFVDHEVSIDFSSDLVPEYEQSIFQIKNFSRIRQSNQSQILSDENEIVYSDPPLVTKSGLTWRLKVYPNGNGIAKGNYISVFLEMLKGLPDQNTQKYEYRVEMINHRSPMAQVVREFASEFEVGECWGYNRFYRIDLLDREGYLNQEDDSITLKFFVRAPCYAQHCQDQERHILSLQKQIENQQKEMDLIKDKSYQMQKKYKKQQNQKLAAQKLIPNSNQFLNLQQDDIDHNKLSQEEISSLHEENNVELDAIELGQNQQQKNQIDQNSKQINSEIIQGEDQSTSQNFIKELKDKQKRNEQKLVSNQTSIQMAIQNQQVKKQNNQKQKNSNEITVRNPFDDDKEESKIQNEDQEKIMKKQSRQSLKNPFFGQQKELNQNQGFQLQVCKNNFQQEIINTQNNIKQINDQFRSNNPAMKQINPKSQRINEQIEESKFQNNDSSQKQDKKFGMNILLNQFKQGMKQDHEEQIKKKKKIDKNSHYEKIMGQNQNIIEGIDDNDKSSSDCDQNINQKLQFNENQSIFHSENIFKKQQHLKHAKNKFEEQEYDKIIKKNKKESKKLEKEIKNMNKSQRDMNCSNNSNSSLSQNEEELREKEQYRQLKESLKQLQKRANQNLNNNLENLKNNQSNSSAEEETKLQIQINPYLAKSSIEHSHINYDDGMSASDPENNLENQDCFNMASILYSGKSPIKNQQSQMINENIFGSPQNKWLKQEQQNNKIEDEKISEVKLNNYQKIGTGLINQNNEFEAEMILSSPDQNIDANLGDQSYIQSSINASENIQSNQEIQIKNEQQFQETKIKISQFSKDSNFQTAQYDESEFKNQLDIECILSKNKELRQNEKVQKIVQKYNQSNIEEEKQFQNNEAINQIQYMNNTQKIQQIRKLAQKHEMKEQKLLNRIQNLHQEKVSQFKESDKNDENSTNILIQSQILRQSNSSSANNSQNQLPPQSQKSQNFDKERKKQTLQLLNSCQIQENKTKNEEIMQQNKIQSLKRITSSVINKETPQKNSNQLNTSIEQIQQLSTRGQSQTNIIVAGTITSNQKLLAGLNQLKQKRMLKQNNLSSPNSTSQFNPPSHNNNEQ